VTAKRPGSTGAAGIVDMGDERLMRDPFGGYSRIRERAPLVRALVRGVTPVWLVTRHDDVKEVLSDRRFVNNPASVPGMRVANRSEQILRGPHGTPPEYLKYRLPQMGSFDGAAHARLRRLVSPAFTARSVAGMRPRIEEITRELVDRLPAAGGGGAVDLIRHLAYPLPSTVLSELVGIPRQDLPRWHRLYRGTWSATGGDKTAAWRDMVAYVRALIAARRAEPAGDLLSGLIHSPGQPDDPLTETEMITMVMNLGLAGYQSTADLISNGTAALFTHPEQLARLRDDPRQMPAAVHELLRYCTPTQVARMRYATEDVEIGGMPVRRGEAVGPVLVAANYDPRRFDDPRRLDIARHPEGHRESHLAFGGGPHYCLGAALARMECEVALTALLARFPGLAMAVDPHGLEYELMPGQWRILRELPVRL
jgi:cytochrome P450